jgi:hypothetical protein
MAWQQSMVQTAMNGQCFSLSELFLWHGISSVLAAVVSITMPDDIA